MESAGGPDAKKMIGALTRILNLKPGDLNRGWPFFAYLFLIIASYVMGQASSKALFLEQFDILHLPYADIAIALLVGAVVAIYLRASRRTSLKNLLLICLVFFSASAFFFWWWAAHYSAWPWVFPILYIWVGIFGVLAPAQVWTLANFVWTTREAKRVFTLLGSGAILGGIFGGLVAKLVANRLGTESLLLISGVFILLCVGLVEIIWRNRDGDDSLRLGAEDAADRSLKQGVQVIGGSSLLQTIAVLICVASTVATIAGWQYTAIAKRELGDKDALTAFFGSVTFYTGALSLVTQLLITSRILRRFGVGVALVILPMALTAGSLGMLISGGIVAATLLRASDQVFRYSVDKSAAELLYLPIPGDVKLQAKSVLDTVVWRLGEGLAGFTILLFGSALAFQVEQLAWVNLAFLVIWIAVAVLARRQYVATLNSNMQQLDLDPQRNSAPVLDVLTTNMFVAKLNSKDTGEILYALNLFEMGQQHGTHSVVRSLLEHPSPEIRKKAVMVLNGAADKSARALIAPLLQDENLEVRTEALLYMMRHHHFDPLEQIQELDDFAHYSIRSATVAFLSRPGPSQNLEAARFFLDAMVNEEGAQAQRTRLEAARIIGSLPDHFSEQLDRLLHDTDEEVVRNAIRAVGALRKQEFAGLLIASLKNPQLRDDAMEAILALDESVTGRLREQLEDRSVSIKIRREIPAVLVRIGTPEAMRILSDNLIQADNILRYRIIAGLNKLTNLHGEHYLDKDTVETVLIGEILGHYRSYQLLASTNGEVTEALHASMREDLERIFRLLKLLSPEHDVKSAYLSLQSKHAVTHANALEFLDNALKPQLRSLLVPLIDRDVTEAERAQLADRILRVKVNNIDEAISILCNSEDPWLRSCASLWESKKSDATNTAKA